MGGMQGGGGEGGGGGGAVHWTLSHFDFENVSFVHII